MQWIEVYEAIKQGDQWEIKSGGLWAITKTMGHDVMCIIAWPDGSYIGPFRKSRFDMTKLIIQRGN
jgi:hypothetical protein